MSAINKELNDGTFTFLHYTKSDGKITTRFHSQEVPRLEINVSVRSGFVI